MTNDQDPKPNQCPNDRFPMIQLRPLLNTLGGRLGLRDQRASREDATDHRADFETQTPSPGLGSGPLGFGSLIGFWVLVRGHFFVPGVLVIGHFFDLSYTPPLR
jgi:hypothetical protein